MASSDKTPDVTPLKEPVKEPLQKVKSPVIRGGFGTIATPANNIGGDQVRKQVYRRVCLSFSSHVPTLSPGT